MSVSDPLNLYFKISIGHGHIDGLGHGHIGEP